MNDRHKSVKKKLDQPPSSGPKKRCSSRALTHQVEEPEHTLHLNGIDAVTIGTLKVGELVNSLIVAMRENKR